MRCLLTAILFLALIPCGQAQFRGLIINEFSQGDQGSREYIELLVAGHRTCSDSTADIRGWIVDDQNGWYGSTNITDGHYRFKDVPQWAAVPFGSIILLYNAASGQKNLSITTPDDSTDVNKDYVYILPINTKTLLEEHDNTPDNLSPNPAYVYPSATSTTGYNGASNLWPQHIALNNTGGDVLSVVSRAKRDSAFFSIGYAYTIAVGYRSPTVAIANVGLATSAYLTDSSYKLATHWAIAAVPFAETPGLPNGGVNTTWVQSMRTTPQALRTYTTACSNGPYNFFGQTITATGAYTVLASTAFGCVDTNQLYVVIKQSDVKDTTACDSLLYKGTKYTSNTMVIDHISSVVINCDSIVRTLRITIKKSSSSFTKACSGAGQTYTFNGQTFSASGQYTVKLVNAQGCDSAARLYLTLTKLDSLAVAGCGSVVYNGQTYTASTTRFDTAKSVVTNCDSLIRKIKITVNQPATTFSTACAVQGTPYVYNGTPLFTTGLYTTHYTTVTGCDSAVKLYVVFRNTVVNTVAGCDSVLFQNKWYLNNAVVQDTIKSVVTNCDSLLRLNEILINRSKTTQLTACVQAGGSYAFFGQTLTGSGNYSHVLQTINGCDSIIKLRLTIATLQTQTITGCDSIRVNGQSFYNPVVLTDTLRNNIGCDSLIRIRNIVINHTVYSYSNVCLNTGQTYSFNGQTLGSSGQYTATFARPALCDSVVQLKLVIPVALQQTMSGCGLVVYNGSTYTSSTLLRDTLRSANLCDSVYRNTQINVLAIPQTFTTACIKTGQAYNFNGQALTTTGLYSTTYQTATCDSLVRLYLMVSQTRNQTSQGCDSVIFAGKKYVASTVVQDTVRSLVSGCDSLVTTTNIIVHTIKHQTISVCLRQGQTYNFNGQILSSTGSYQTIYNTAFCDSVVHLYLVVSKQQNQNIRGCDTVVYNGIIYNASTDLADTVRSKITGCDSLIKSVSITVNSKSILTISRDTTICLGGTATLKASSPNAVVGWTGFGNSGIIPVSPQTTTQYFVSAIDTNGCINKASVTVVVQDFSLLLSANKNPALSGTTVVIQSKGSLAYTVIEWQPISAFSNQANKSQLFSTDTSLNIIAVAQSSAGCKDTATLLLVAIPIDDIYIPSGFTPNGDGRNDEVRVMGTGIKELTFTVFNRWGQMVFQTTDKGKGWDGKSAGVLQAAGTYVYVARVKKTSGQVVEKKGTVTLIR